MLPKCPSCNFSNYSNLSFTCERIRQNWTFKKVLNKFHCFYKSSSSSQKTKRNEFWRNRPSQIWSDFPRVLNGCQLSHMLGLPVPAPDGEANGNAETATEAEVSMSMSTMSTGDLYMILSLFSTLIFFLDTCDSHF